MRRLIIVALLLAEPALASPYSFPLREPLAYDGDTLYAVLPTVVPDELREISIRIRGIDTPEIRGKCENEKMLARAAREFVRARLAAASEVQFFNIEWDKYGGRVLATVLVDGHNLAEWLIEAGIARRYDGEGPRESWCPGG